MTVAEIKAKLPEAEVYEFRDDAKYIILVDPARVDLDAFVGWPDKFAPKATIVAVRLREGTTFNDAVAVMECRPDACSTEPGCCLREGHELPCSPKFQ